MLISVRQQRQKASALDRGRQLPLVEGLRARDTTRHDLARLGDVPLERREILVVNVLHALGGEAAELLAARKAAHDALSERSLSSSSELASSRARSRRPPPLSSSSARAMGEGSVTAASICTTR